MLNESIHLDVLKQRITVVAKPQKESEQFADEESLNLSGGFTDRGVVSVEF